MIPRPLSDLASDLAVAAERTVPRALPVGPAELDPGIREAAERSLADGTWARYEGPRRRELEAALAQRFGHARARTCCSGTFAVELALRALRLEPGDEVALAGYDYPGNFRAIEAVGATPLLVDLEGNSFRLTVERLDAAIGERTRAAIVSHLHGELADGAALRAWADARGVALVEDACQATGAAIDGRPVGSFGHLAVLSFGGSKTLTAGRGGAVLTSDDTFAQRMTIAAERGNDAYPLSELQAAVLLPQLMTLDALNERRRRTVGKIRERLTARSHGLLVDPAGETRGEPAYYKWGLLLPEGSEALREGVLRCLEAARLPAGEGFRGLARRAGKRSRAAGELTESERAARSTIVISHPALTVDDETVAFYADAIARTCAAIAASRNEF